MGHPDMQPGASSRRGFLGAALTGAALTGAAVSAAPVAASAGRKPRKYVERDRVDVHAHALTPAYKQALTDAGITLIGGIPVPQWSPQEAVAFMDAHGIQIQMLSVSDPGVAFLSDGVAATRLASTVNDELAAIVKARPTRFGAFAVLPLHDPEAALAEAKRALDVLKLDGIGLLSSSGGRYLGDPAFAPLLAELHRRKAWVFVHPTAIASAAKPSYAMPDFIAEYPFDTTRTIISLLFNNAFGSYPGIRWHFAHGGGVVPMLRFRLTVLAGQAKAVGKALGLPDGSAALTEKSVTRALERSWFDTALVADAPALEAVAEMAGAKRIVFGSDWPFAARIYSDKVQDPSPALSAVFTPTERRRIDRLNGRAQFPRAARATPKS